MFFLTACSTKKNITNVSGNIPIEKQNSDILDWFKLYSSDWFNVQYPSTYSVQTNYYRSLVSFLTKQEWTWDVFVEYFSIYKSDYTWNLDDFVSKSKNYISKYVNWFSIVKEKSIKVSGIKAKNLIYNGKQGLKNMKWNNVYLKKWDALYFITYQAIDSDYEKYLWDYKKVLDTFLLK